MLCEKVHSQAETGLALGVLQPWGIPLRMMMGANTQMWWTLGLNKSALNLEYSVAIHLQRLEFECHQSWTSRLGALAGLHFATADPGDVNRNPSGTDTTPGRWLLLAAENSGHLLGSLPSLVHRDGNTECLDHTHS